MTGLGVGVAGGSSPEFALSQQAVWASLPESLRADARAPRAVAVDGRAAGWVDALSAAVRSGAAGVLVVRPSAGARSALLHTIAGEAAERGVAVAVETAWASHPAVAEFSRAISAGVAGAALVDSVAVVPSGDEAATTDVLLDQLAVVRSATGPLDPVRFADGTAHGYTILGDSQGALVTLGGVRSAASAPRLSLTVYGASGQVGLQVGSAGPAAPAQVRVVDAAGATVQPSRYESAGRASWRRLHDAIDARAQLADLADLAADLDLVAALSPKL